MKLWIVRWEHESVVMAANEAEAIGIAVNQRVLDEEDLEPSEAVQMTHPPPRWDDYDLVWHEGPENITLAQARTMCRPEETDR